MPESLIPTKKMIPILNEDEAKYSRGFKLRIAQCGNSLFAMQPFDPSDGCLTLRKLMANG
jgi:hypothetical protein